MTDTTTPIPVHVLLVLDRSGSMQAIRSDVVGGVNSFLADQKSQPGECRVTICQFDTQGFDYTHRDAPLADIPAMTESDFSPRGGTPLYDALHRAITDASRRAQVIGLANDVAGNTAGEAQLVVIVTDGQENASTQHRRTEILELIETRQGEGWTFTFLGANQDAYAEAAAMGIARGSTQNFAGDGRGVAAAFSSLSANATHYRRAAAVADAAALKTATMDFYAFAGKEAEKDLTDRAAPEAALSQTDE